MKLTLFYADWCGACRAFKPVWENLKEELKRIKNDTVKIEEYEEGANKELFSKEQIQSYPTIRLYKKNGSEDYKGGRSIENIMKFLDIEYEPVATSYYPKPLLDKNKNGGRPAGIYDPVPSTYYPNHPYLKGGRNEEADPYYLKYLKYKNKYLQLKKMA